MTPQKATQKDLRPVTQVRGLFLWSSHSTVPPSQQASTSNGSPTERERYSGVITSQNSPQPNRNSATVRPRHSGGRLAAISRILRMHNISAPARKSAPYHASRLCSTPEVTEINQKRLAAYRTQIPAAQQTYRFISEERQDDQRHNHRQHDSPETDAGIFMGGGRQRHRRGLGQ